MNDFSYPKPGRSLFLVMIVLLLVVACMPHQPQSGEGLRKLLIDPSIMPEGWDISLQGDPPDNIRQHSGASIQFDALTPELRVAAQRVYRYESERQAAKEFKRMLSIEFNSSSIASVTPWEPPPELPYTSPVADQFYFACHLGKIKQTARICQALGQYKNYLVVFHTYVDPEYMTFEDIRAILIAIDALMAEHLEG